MFRQHFTRAVFSFLPCIFVVCLCRLNVTPLLIMNVIFVDQNLIDCPFKHQTTLQY